MAEEAKFSIVDKAPVVFISESPLGTTGFGRVALELAKHITKFPIYFIGSGGELLPTNLGIHKVINIPDTTSLRTLLFTLDPQVIITLHAPNVLMLMSHINPTSAKKIEYIVIDNEPINKSMVNYLWEAHKVITPSKYSQGALSRISIDAGVVPHGVNPKIFFPLPKPAETINFLCVQRNNIRKQLGRLVKAFSMLHAPDARLLLMTNPTQTGQGGVDLYDLATKYGIDDKVKFEPFTASGVPIAYEKMVYYYNRGHVNVYSGGGEGFGMPFIESAACGIPSISTAIPVLEELFNLGYPIDGQTVHAEGFDIYEMNHGVVTVSSSDIYIHNTGEIKLVDIEALRDAMQYLYENPSEIKKLGEAALETSKNWYWDKPASLLTKIIEEALEVK